MAQNGGSDPQNDSLILQMRKMRAGSGAWEPPRADVGGDPQVPCAGRPEPGGRAAGGADVPGTSEVASAPSR